MKGLFCWSWFCTLFPPWNGFI